ncbi:MAG: PilN domain-containing protein [Acidobacteria bacterium]|nr:PilN domain-containing protein [Acidobacteriota bacterium]MBK8809376.1 PilN domain-containing protein [Acidobacteriota bacterium]
MIKVNLLNSVTERHSGTVATVERKVGSATSRLLLMAAAVFVLAIALIGWDVVSTQMAKADAEARLEEQKRIASELEAVMKEQKELEAKIAAIDARIGAIKKLREEQSGPSAVLDALRERISMVPGLYLESVEQKGDQLEIRGTSNDESAPTRFGQSLEFSGGLFSNLGIETTRKEEAITTQASTTTPTTTNPAEAPKLVSFDFVIRCAYSAKAGQNPTSTTAANQPGPGGPPNGAPAPPQVAKN